ncbi:MAG TPA: hypothetical protein VL358_11755 [Caulobacteraceae bacterium]|jgi:DNA-binding beta-propeller fold protein YncE|nr:hypothetical protein [Caulobacteraceae bacterium]
MRSLLNVAALALAMTASAATAQPPAAPYKVLKTVKAGGDGGFDYIYADAANRRLYIPRTAANPRITVFDLDTLAPVGTIPNVNARGAVVDAKSGHGFSSSKPVAMWDAKTLGLIKTIDVQGNPDGILADQANQRVYVFSHVAPNVTVINAAEGAVLGAFDLGGMPEQAATDGKGRLYIDLEDKDQVAVVDAKTMAVTGKYGLEGKCGGPAGLALDAASHVLFVTCRMPATMTVLNANTGAILAVLPIGPGTDGATFNPATKEAFSSNGGDGTLTVVKELSPTTFAVTQTVATQVGAKVLTLDAKTNRILTDAAEYGPPPPPGAAPPAGGPPGGAGAPGGGPPGGGPPGGRPRRGPMLPDSFTILAVGK